MVPMNIVRSTLLVLLGSGLTLCAFARGQGGQDTTKKGTIIEGTVNIYDYDPKDTGTDADVAGTLATIGPVGQQWYQHVMTLSNPYFEGRAPGSDGIVHAANYVEFWMKQAGLTAGFPATDGESEFTTYRQTFELPGAGPKVIDSTVLVGERALERGKDYVVLGSSGNGRITAPLAFAGYAIESGKDGYTSFSESGEELQGRIAVFFRYEPIDQEGGSRWSERRWSEFSAAAPKLQALAKRGAVGVIMVTPPDARDARRGMESTATSRFGERLAIPAVQISTERMDELMQQADADGRGLAEWRQKADEGSVKSAGLKDDVVLTLATEVTDGTIGTDNIGGVLRGAGALADEWVIVGSHYDHVGFGAYGADPRNRGKLHPGADDNASGTSAMLCMTKLLSDWYASEGAPKDRRSILFMAFSAEEIGLDGSKYWTEHPTLKQESINAMINLDMVGRLRNDELVVGGIGSAKSFKDWLRPIFEASGLTIHADPSGRGPSDHASFYSAGIPVLFMFTGVHGDYHKPTDFGWTVNPGGAAKVIALTESIAKAMSTDAKLEFEGKSAGSGQDRGYAKVRLGVSPGYGESSDAGVLVEAVSDGTCAAEAGIKKGDVLLAWDGDALEGAGDMMDHLRKHAPGDKVKLKVKRDGGEIEIEVTLKASKPRG